MIQEICNFDLLLSIFVVLYYISCKSIFFKILFSNSNIHWIIFFLFV